MHKIPSSNKGWITLRDCSLSVEIMVMATPVYWDINKLLGVKGYLHSN